MLSVGTLMRECWAQNPKARLTMLRVKKTLNKLREEWENKKIENCKDVDCCKIEILKELESQKIENYSDKSSIVWFCVEVVGEIMLELFESLQFDVRHLFLVNRFV